MSWMTFPALPALLNWLNGLNCCDGNRNCNLRSLPAKLLTRCPSIRDSGNDDCDPLTRKLLGKK
jgi:hypothetical protein